MEKILLNKEQQLNYIENLVIDEVMELAMLDHPKITTQYNLNSFKNFTDSTFGNPFETENLKEVNLSKRAFLEKLGYEKKIEKLIKELLRPLERFEKETKLANKN